MATIAVPKPVGYERPAILDWLTTVDHKKLGILYLYTTMFFFAVGGVLALLVRTQLAVADNNFVSHERVQRDLHHARLGDAVPVHHPGVGRLR